MSTGLDSWLFDGRGQRFVDFTLMAVRSTIQMSYAACPRVYAIVASLFGS
ncbi:MAG: hypothetical protein ACP5M0_03825 [Desulfomonilaceae bacterium]